MAELGFEPGPFSFRAHGHLLVMLHLRLEYYFPHFRAYASIYKAYNDLVGFLTACTKLLTSEPFFLTCPIPQILANSFYKSLKKSIQE